MGGTAKTFYEILGVPSDARQPDINTAFRELVRQGHPDRFTDPGEKAEAEKRLKEITEAYNTLGKPRLRLEYDKTLLAPVSSASVKSPQEQAKDLFAQARAKLRADDFGTALALFDHVLRLEPENVEAMFHAGMLRLKNPQLRNQGSLLVEKAIDLAPYNPTFVVQYAEVLLESGLHIRAQRLLETAAANFKSDPAIGELLAKAHGEKSGGFSLFGKKK